MYTRETLNNQDSGVCQSWVVVRILSGDKNRKRNDFLLNIEKFSCKELGDVTLRLFCTNGNTLMDWWRAQLFNFNTIQYNYEMNSESAPHFLAWCGIFQFRFYYESNISFFSIIPYYQDKWRMCLLNHRYGYFLILLLKKLNNLKSLKSPIKLPIPLGPTSQLRLSRKWGDASTHKNVYMEVCVREKALIMHSSRRCSTKYTCSCHFNILSLWNM